MTTNESNECADCGYSVERSGANEVKSCPKCGGERWIKTVGVEDSVGCYDESGIAAMDKHGRLQAERIQTTDLNTSANLSADLGKPSRIYVERKKRVLGFNEEGDAAPAAALATCYNKIRGTNYSVEEKTGEDSDYADRVFASKNDAPPRIDVQIRHLDTGIIAGVGRHGTFDCYRTAVEIVASIRVAIDDKAMVDPQVKAKTVLLLIVPVPLGAGIREAIEKDSFDYKGFKEIWISPFHEQSFPLTRS